MSPGLFGMQITVLLSVKVRVPPAIEAVHVTRGLRSSRVETSERVVGWLMVGRRLKGKQWKTKVVLMLHFPTSDALRLVNAFRF